MQKKKIVFASLFCIFLFISESNYSLALGSPNLKLPFTKGESWGITTGYGGSSYHQNKDYFAIDFNLPGDADKGKPILAAANGNIIFANWTAGYGWNVIIDHGNGYKTLYAHFNEKPSISGQVKQGQEIGKCGMSGGTSTGYHLHFALYYNENACKPEPMSGYTNFTEGEWYTSDNCITDPTYRWDFNTNYDLEGWTMTNVEEYSVQDGFFYINPGAEDPYINSSEISVNAEDNSLLILRISSNACDNNGAVYFTTFTSPNWGEDKKVNFYVHNDGQSYRRYCVPMDSNINWKDTITHIRVDPADYGISDDPNDTIGFDYIYLAKPDWSFNSSPDTEGWTKNDSIEMFLVWDKLLYINPEKRDPFILSPVISKDASEYKYIFIRMASSAPDGIGALYFTTSSYPNWGEDKKSDFHIYNDGYFHNYIISMENKWIWRDTITRIRIDISDGGIEGIDDDMVYIDCVHIF